MFMRLYGHIFQEEAISAHPEMALFRKTQYSLAQTDSTRCSV
jgi:hypothetical protein